jgi:hypothetical protein
MVLPVSCYKMRHDMALPVTCEVEPGIWICEEGDGYGIAVCRW